jgi:hypothetical protein
MEKIKYFAKSLFIKFINYCKKIDQGSNKISLFFSKNSVIFVGLFWFFVGIFLIFSSFNMMKIH